LAGGTDTIHRRPLTSSHVVPVGVDAFAAIPDSARRLSIISPIFPAPTARSAVIVFRRPSALRIHFRRRDRARRLYEHEVPCLAIDSDPSTSMQTLLRRAYPSGWPEASRSAPRQHSRTSPSSTRTTNLLSSRSSSAAPPACSSLSPARSPARLRQNPHGPRRLPRWQSLFYSANS